MYENELYHFGVKGMKWGIRRYQNKDGTLTPAGKKRYDKEMAKIKEEQRIVNNKKRTQAKIDKLEAARKKLEEDKESLKNKNKDSDESVNTKSSGESGNNQNHQQINQNPQTVSKGKSFTKVLLSEMAAPAAKDVGKQLLKSGFTAFANEKVVKRFADKYGLNFDDYLVFTNNKKK